MCWYLWWERRQASHGEVIQASGRSAQSIIALALNYKCIKKVGGAAPIHRHGWLKPLEDFVKLNVDAAFDVDTGAGGTGVVIRDHLWVLLLWVVGVAFRTWRMLQLLRHAL